MDGRYVKGLVIMSMFVLVGTTLMGCAGMEYGPKNGVLYWPSEYVAADRAVEAARMAGKDTECPEEFNIVRTMANDAYELHPQCRKHEAMELALQSRKRANAVCPVKQVMKPLPPPPPPVAEKKIIDRLSLHLHFDINKATVKANDLAELDGAVNFIKKYPTAKVVVEGHTDNVGSDAYNHNLSHNRADTVKRYLVEKGGLDKARIRSAGYGESRPFKSNDDAWGRYWNRRVDILIVSE